MTGVPSPPGGVVRPPGDPVAEAVRLANRAIARFATGDPDEQDASEVDLARATALLDWTPAPAGDAAPTGTHPVAAPAARPADAYLACATAYAQRDLWELEQQMCGAAHRALLATPGTAAADEVLGRRAMALVRVLCARRAVGTTGLDADIAAVADEVRAASAGLIPDTRRDAAVRIFRCVIAAVAGEPPPEDVRDLAADLAGTAGRVGDEAVEALLLIRSLTAAAAGDHAAVVAAAGPFRAAREQVSHLPPYRLATALEIDARQAMLDPAAAAMSAPAVECARRSREQDEQARLRLLASARARLETERLRVEVGVAASAAVTDELTGLANRRGWNAALTAARPGSVAVLIIDLDHFKEVNDTFGHQVGDRVLATVGGRLRENTRPGDVCARLGGDEFAVLLSGVDAGSAQLRARRISEVLAGDPWYTLAPGLEVSVSIGVAEGTDASSPADLVADADAALYRAKDAGRGRVRGFAPTARRDP